MSKVCQVFRKSMLAALAVLALSVPLSATTINFNTHANGVPYAGLGDLFLPAEYAGLGVTIIDSDIAPAITNVDLIHPLNIGTAISGYYINVGAFVGINPTFVEFTFAPNVLSAILDFASFSGNVHLLAYDAASVQIFSSNPSGLGNFIDQAGFPLHSGSAAVNGVGPIAKIRLEAALNEGLIVDNLNFTQVAVAPEPQSVLLLFIGLIGISALRRRLS